MRRYAAGAVPSTFRARVSVAPPCHVVAANASRSTSIASTARRASDSPTRTTAAGTCSSTTRGFRAADSRHPRRTSGSNSKSDRGSARGDRASEPVSVPPASLVGLPWEMHLHTPFPHRVGCIDPVGHRADGVPHFTVIRAACPVPARRADGVQMRVQGNATRRDLRPAPTGIHTLSRSLRHRPGRSCRFDPRRRATRQHRPNVQRTTPITRAETTSHRLHRNEICAAVEPDGQFGEPDPTMAPAVRQLVAADRAVS